MLKEISVPEIFPFCASFFCQQGHLTKVDLTPTGEKTDKWNLFSASQDDFLAISRWIEAYFAGEYYNALPIVLPFAPESFTRKVLEETRKIPFGKLLTYKELSEASGYKKGWRGCGSTLGKNPLPLVIPCHRVIHSDGTIGGFAFGIAVKKELISFERRFLFSKNN